MAQEPEHSRQLPFWTDPVMRLMLRLRRFAWDFGGVILLALASMTLLALIGLTSGAWLSPWAAVIRRWLGWGSIFMVAALGLAGLLMLYQRRHELSKGVWWRVISLEIAAFALLGLLAVFGGIDILRAEQGLDGGLVGWGISEFITIIFNPLGPAISGVLRALLLLIVFGITAFYGLGLVGPFLRVLERQIGRTSVEAMPVLDDQPAVSVGEMSTASETSTSNGGYKKRVSIPPEHRKQFKVDEDGQTSVFDLPPRDDRLPPLEILQVDKATKPDERHINQSAGLIEKTLSEFGIPARVVGFRVGPTVTQFAVEPGYKEKGTKEEDEAKQKVRVSQISGLQKDLALALSAKRLRIQAPVPGRSYVGIEVPNEKSAVVGLRPILESEAFSRLDSPLAIALGRDVSGQPVVADLSRMPHLLIAGTTGSGKSVCIAALTVCLAMNNTPEDLQIVMIDPKMVELVRFNGLPHLLGKVETNLDRIAGVLRWVVFEMERRYKLLEELRARDIDGYNRKARRRKEFESLPRMVVMIDELADLMMNAAEQTESTIVRLAQMARATGIHLIVATQRPSTDVVTGLIKANFPARLSFAVASAIDSRVILDMTGAESLLGRGDMLFLPPEIGTPIRSQGAMVTDREVEGVVSYWQDSWQGVIDTDAPWDKWIDEQSVLADRDDLVEQAIEIVRETGRASASMMQRRLRIGYPRAARLIDELEDLGIVGPSQGGGRERDVLIGPDEIEEEFFDNE